MVRFNHAAAVRMYTRLVKAGRKTLDAVPEEYGAEEPPHRRAPRDGR